MILSEDDLAIFAPGANLTVGAIEGALWYLQSILEGDAGAGRPLELAQRTELGDMNTATQSFWLKQYPIVIDDDHPIQLEVRIGGNVSDGWGRPLPVGEWRLLENDQFILDQDNRVFLDYGKIALFNTTWNNGLHYGDYSWYGERTGFSSYRATYWAGFDFESDTSEVNKLKGAAGAILTYMVQSGVFKGVQELEVPFDEFRIKYVNDSGLIGRIPIDMLLPFRALRWRGGY